MNNCCVPFLLLFLGMASVNTLLAAVTVEKGENGATVKIDGQPFTEYLTKAGHEPALYPVIGPTGKPVTRSYPFTPPGETKDHPHHQSFWITYGDVNNVDFWTSNRTDDKADTGPHIKHREFAKIANQGETAEIVTHNDWMNGAERICEDERKFVFGSGPNDSRWIDCTIKITATDGDVTFGDTKEGAFAIRVADSMRVEAKTGGKIVNSEGKTDDATWGQPARWVDYTGPVDGETVGIAMLTHPSSFRPTPRWHVRGYGLFAANPFGQRDFPNPDAAEQGPFTLKKGESLTLRYRVVLHKGATDRMLLEQAFKEFAGSE
jgi:hypothetical protein